MNRQKEISELHQILIDRRNALERFCSHDLQLLKDLRINSEDNAFEANQQDISSKLAEVENKELNKINNALDRIKLGKYGLCESCNSKIALPRLQALPYATFCISCQRKKEEGGDEDWVDQSSFTFADKD